MQLGKQLQLKDKMELLDLHQAKAMQLQQQEEEVTEEVNLPQNRSAQATAAVARVGEANRNILREVRNSEYVTR